MDVFEKVLALRPTNAAMRLGPASRLPLLNPRDIARAVEDRPLLNLWVPDLRVLPGLLRAARELDAAVGLTSPYAPLDRDAPHRFVEAVHEAAAEVRHERPLFLQAGPIRLTSAEPRALQQGSEHVFRCVDAGFSLVSIDAGRLSMADQVRASRELSLPASERELSVEVSAPRVTYGRTSPHQLEELLGHLSAVNVRPRFVRVDAAAEPVDGQEQGRALDAELMEALHGVAAAFNVELALEDPGLGALAQLGDWLALGARKVDAAHALGRICARALPEELREPLTQKAAAAGLPLTEVLAQAEQFFAGVSAADRERAEALCFAEALDLIEALRLRRSGGRCMHFLAEQSGY